jgi:hypothetical protein
MPRRFVLQFDIVAVLEFGLDGRVGFKILLLASHGNAVVAMMILCPVAWYQPVRVRPGRKRSEPPGGTLAGTGLPKAYSLAGRVKFDTCLGGYEVLILTLTCYKSDHIL